MEFNFSQNQYYMIFTLLGLVIFLLSIGISYFYLKIQKVKAQNEQIKAEFIKREEERQNFVRDSIKTICLAYSQGQVETSEACIRLRMLIDRIDFLDNEHYPNIFSLYDEIAHFKTHEARNALSLQERTSEDKQRFAIEDKYYDNFKRECEDILSRLKQQ